MQSAVLSAYVNIGHSWLSPERKQLELREKLQF